MSRQDFRENPCEMHCSDDVFKASMIRCRVDKFRPRELSQSSESLYGSSINYRLFGFADPYVPVDGILDESPSLRHDSQPCATAYSKLPDPAPITNPDEVSKTVEDEK
jgi:hypothetical protein